MQPRLLVLGVPYNACPHSGMKQVYPWRRDAKFQLMILIGRTTLQQRI
jgi:hypothetical protein